MEKIANVRWPQGVEADVRLEFARIWRDECGADIWESDYSRIVTLSCDGKIAAGMVYLRIRSHLINFGRMTLPAYRGRGYAGRLLK